MSEGIFAGSGIVLPPGVVIDDSRDNLWGHRDSLNQRFPGCKGAILWQVCSHIYVKDSNSTRPLLPDPTLPVSDTNIVLLKRSPLNCRDESSSRDEYSEMILQHGMNWDARYKVCTVAVDNPPHPDFRKVLAACHCVESVYDLHSNFADHPMVRLAMSRGALHAVDMVAGTPEDSSFQMSI